MNKSRRDIYGVPSILAVNEEGNPVAIKAANDGSVKVTLNTESSGDKRLKGVIKLDLGQSRNKELFDKSFNEMTIPVIEGKITVYLGTSTEDRALTIDKPLSITTKEEKLYISNGSGSGSAEIWLWE